MTGVFGPLNSKKIELGPNLSSGRKFGLTLTQNSFSLSRVLSDFRNNNKKVLPDRYSATTPGEACVAAPLPRFFGDVPHQRPLEHSRKHLPCHPRRAPKKPNPTGAINPEEERTPRSGADAQPQRVSGWPRGKQVRRRHEVDSPPALSHSSIQMRRLPPAVALLLRRSLASAALLPAPVRPLPLSPVIF